MPPSSLDATAFRQLVRAQDGLFNVAQARACGLSSSALSRRSASGALRRVLPGVYADGSAQLTHRQRSPSAVLYTAGTGCLTGAAALHWRHIPHLPRELSLATIDVLVPRTRTLRSTAWVRVTRTARYASPTCIDGVMTASVGRATVDAALRLSSVDSVFALLSSVINAGKLTVGDIRAELDGAATRGSRALRLALAEADANTRSVAEADARALFRAAGLPAPVVNGALVVAGRVFVPDFRWGRVIVEIDSRAFHLLEVGSWERTQERRAALFAAGYVVLPFTPSQIRTTPEDVVAAIRHAIILTAAS